MSIGANESPEKLVDQNWLMDDESILANAKQARNYGISESQDVETQPDRSAKHKYAKDAWFLVGNLISAGILPVPDMDDASDRNKLEYAVVIIEGWIRYNNEG